MDFLKKAQSALGGASGSGNHQGQPAGQGQPQGQAQGDDYVDKGLSMIQKKLGMASNREQNERMTDAGREFYEKQTGKKVNSKVSLVLSSWW